MGTTDNQLLKHEIKTRVNDSSFERLSQLLQQSACRSMSELVRHILDTQPVTLLHRDKSKDLLSEQLAGIRKELRSIGVNINQITRDFNIAAEREQKLLQALGAAEQYEKVGNKVDQLLTLIHNLSEQWLLR